MHSLACSSACMTRPQYHTSPIVLLLCFHRGGWDRNGTDLAHDCADFAARISWYHSRLSWHYRKLSWSNHILDPRFLRWFCNSFFSDLFVVLFAHPIYLVGNNYHFSSLPIVNILFVWHWALLVLVAYLSTDVYVNLLSVSANILSNPVICWILGPNSSIISCQSIPHWGSLRVVAYTRLFWYVNTFISYRKRIRHNRFRHSTMDRSSFSVVV